MQRKGKLKILFVSVEVSPFAKTGGLADVAGSLTQELVAMGNDVRLVMPKYKMIKASADYVTDFPVQVDSKKETCIVKQTAIDFKASGENKVIPVYFIDNYHYYDRDNIYGYLDDAERFALFCNAVMEMLPKINFQPDIIHCNDWHTGPICMLLKEKYIKYPFYKDISTVFTIHNLEYQGHFPKETYKLFNVGEEIFIPEKVEFYGVFNFMKAGLVYCDIINTVSETYAKEIQTAQYGERLEGVLTERANDLFGVVNGISYDEFNPSTDKRIYKNYDAENFMLKGKNKRPLQKEMGLPQRKVPVIGLISRLTGQKGLNLVTDVIDEIMKYDVQFVLLGTGEDYYETTFKSLRDKHPEKIGVHIGFNGVLAQRIYASSDIFLMPSRFEPCGLSQIISFRYGVIPVVRATGGLADTVIDYDLDKVNGNGFAFKEFSAEELLKAVERALNLYKKHNEWRQLVKKVLEQDFSWNIPAQKYMNLYNLAIERMSQGMVL